MMRPTTLVGLSILALLAGAGVARAMPSNYPKLDDRKADKLALEVGRFDEDPAQEVVLENNLVRVVVEPEHGGVVSSFYDKIAKIEYTKKAAKGDFGGMFRILAPGTPAKHDWENAKFDVKEIKRGDDAVSIQLSAKGVSGAYTGVTLSKTYTLRANDARLRIDFKAANDMVSVAPLPMALHVHNTLGIPGVKGFFFWPVEEGVSFVNAPGSDEVYERNPTRGFEGYVSDDGNGLAMVMDYRLLKQFYCWNSQGTYPRGTLEWFYNNLPVPCGSSISFTAWAYPFTGIKRPYGASADAVANLETGGATQAGMLGNIHVDLATPADAKRQIVMRIQKLPKGDWQTIKTLDMQLQAGQVTSFNFDYTPPVTGTYDLALFIQDGDKEVGRFDAPLIVGKADEPYKLAALEERFAPLDVKARPLNFDYTSPKVVTPHVAWAKPYDGGNASFLFLSDGFHQREAVELAERFDLTPSSSFLTADMEPAMYALGDYYTDINTNDLISRMQTVFKSKKDVNVLVLSGPVWQWFTPWMKSETIDRVRAGMGLVWIDPQATTKEVEAILPVVPVVGAASYQAQWEDGNDHFITRGVPLDAQYMTNVTPFRLAPDSTAIAMAQPITKGSRTPLVAVRQVDKGRVVVLNYNTSAAGHRITPVSSTHEYAMQEYQLSLVARSIFWAAGKVSNAEISSVEAPPGKPLTVRVTRKLTAAVNAPTPMQMHVVFRDRFSRVLEDRQIKDVSIYTPLTLDPPFLPDGVNFVDLILTDATGKTLDWYSKTLPMRRDTELGRLRPDKHAYDMGRPVTMTLLVQGAAQVHGSSLRFRLTDTDGRIVYESTAPAVDGKTPITALVARPPTIRLVGSAELLDDKGRLIDEQRCFVDYHFIPTADDLMVCYGWPAVSESGTPPYLMGPFYQAMMGIGETGTHLRVGHLTPDELNAYRGLDLPVVLSDGMGAPGRQPFTGPNVVEYDKTHDKKLLQRRPCLSDPKTLQAYSYAGDRYVNQPIYQMGIFQMMNGDENTFTAPGYDLDFSPPSLVAFRVWLQTQYDSLAALNKEWGTDFAKWEDVVPNTRYEVAGMQSYASWLDHRVFGDKSFADAFRAFKQGIDRDFPGVRSAASGTGETEGLGGYDWWQLRDSFGGLAPYTGEQTIQQRSFMPDVPQTNWTGYGREDLAELRKSDWWILFHGLARGFCVFAGRNYINPDFTLPDCAVALGKVFDEMNHGAARAFFQTRPRLDPVIYHYSPRSLWTEILYADHDQAEKSTQGMTAIMDAAGIQYGYLAYEQIEQGLLDKSDAKVMFLRHSTALSDKEAAAMRAFVERGGVLVADLLPGVLDGHGMQRAGGVLDDVFGVRQAGTLVLGEGTLAAEGEEDGIRVPKLDCTIGAAAPVIATTGKPLGAWRIGDKTGPAIIVNHLGKGAAVYLATDALGSYLSAQEVRELPRGQAVLQPLNALAASVLTRAGAEPVVKVTDDAGKPYAAGVYRFEGPGQRMIGLIDESGKKKPSAITVQFDRPAFVYDVLAGKPIAAGAQPVGRFSVPFAPNDVGLYALLDYVPRKVVLTMPAHATRGHGVTLEASLDCGEARNLANHVFRVDTTRPDGTPLRPLTGNFTSDHGKLKLACDLALNEPPGVYKVTVREVITGLSSQAEFSVP